MKINTKLKLSAWVPLLMAGFIGIFLLLSISAIETIRGKNILVQRIIQGMNDLNRFTHTYMRYHEDRPRIQFLKEQAALTELIAPIDFRNKEQQRLLNRILGGCTAMKDTFIRLVDNYQSHETGREESLIREVGERISGRLLIELSSILSDALILEGQIDHETIELQKNISVLILFLITTVSLFLSLILMRVMKRIGTSLEVLRRGAGEIASGNLSHRFEMTSQDEIGELSDAFNIMTEKLQQTTVSRDALNEEVEERKVIERALQDQRERFEITLNSIGDAVIATDIEGRITFINPIAEKLTGCDKTDALNLPVYDVARIVDRISGKPVEDIMTPAFTRGQIFRTINYNTLIARDGLKIPIENNAAPIKDGSGNIIGRVIVFRDITGRVKAEETLRKSEMRYRELYTRTPAMLHSIDSGGRIISVSGHWLDKMGYTRDEVIGRKLVEFFTEASRRKAEKIELPAFFKKGASRDVAYQIVTKNGEIIDVLLSAISERDSNGEFIRSLAVFTDITRMKKAQDELEKSRDALELRVQERTIELEQRAHQLSLLASELTLAEERERRRLAGILHDDLQQLLAAARLSIELLPDTVKQEQNSAIDHVLSLIDQSIKASRSLTAELSPPLLRRSGLSAALKWLSKWMLDMHGLAVDLSVDPMLDPMREDYTILLFQSVRELLFNVVKHAGVASARVEMSKDCNSNHCIVVSDVGNGFDAQTVWRDKIGSTGFGLLSIRERMMLMGGRLDVKSQPGMGASFSLILPPERRQPAEIETGNLPANRTRSVINKRSGMPPGGILRVMLVDDHEMMRNGLSTLLGKYPDIQIVAESSDGKEAVRIAEELQPDVILMDINMPRLSGLEATRRIHSAFPHIRIIILSMYEDGDVAATALNAGASVFLTKSGSADRLLDAVHGKDG